jgi:hypothetical protein
MGVTMTFSDVHPGDPMDASNVQQVIDALKGTAGKGVALAVSAVNDATRYALTLENLDATNSRAINVLKSDGSVLIRADVTGVTFGAPLNLTANSVAGSAIQDASVTNAKLGPDVARANLLVNGGFELWQRGTSGFTANGAFSADRWMNGLAGTSTFSVVQQQTSPVAVNSRFSLGFTYNHNAESYIYQKLEDYFQVRGQTLSFSIMVQTSTANAVRPFVQCSSTYTFGAFHTGDGTFRQLTVTAPCPSNATGVAVGLALDASCTAYLDNAMLVYGSQPANYAPLPPADELARCLRYYERIDAANTQQLLLTQAYGAGSTIWDWHLRATKAVTPTLTTAAASQFCHLTATGAASPACTAITAGALFADRITGSTSLSSGLVAGNASQLIAANAATAFLIAEANP